MPRSSVVPPWAILAPSFDADALEVLTAKKNLRLMEVAPAGVGGVETRPISGGLLMQHRDAINAEGADADGNATGDDPTRWRLVAGEPADE